MNVRILDKIKSTINRNTVRIAVNESTTKVDPFNSSQFGQDTLFISNCTSEVNCWIFFNIIYLFYQKTENISNLSKHIISLNGSFCRRGRARTRNPRFWRPVLYQLSYSPMNYSLIYFPSRLYFVSLKITCFLTTGSYFLNSIRSGCNFRLFVTV